jgi:hypothetical protein
VKSSFWNVDFFSPTLESHKGWLVEGTFVDCQPQIASEVELQIQSTQKEIGDQLGIDCYDEGAGEQVPFNMTFCRYVMLRN